VPGAQSGGRSDLDDALALDEDGAIEQYGPAVIVGHHDGIRDQGSHLCFLTGFFA
jgi:hypothetical protein